jgi:hypothetical protein
LTIDDKKNNKNNLTIEVHLTIDDINFALHLTPKP